METVVSLSRKNLHKNREPSEKWKFIQKHGRVCKKCGSTDGYNYLLDHIIPIGVGGDIHNENNFQILCDRCHGKKSGFDRKIMNELVKKKYMTKGILKIFYKPIEECIEYYKRRFKELEDEN